ncbi:uncharacterized protein J3R85_019401 [Psidium guajava]|nr:uncharacterized protein J3R85_019401 [Psidium guajava]
MGNERQSNVAQEEEEEEKKKGWLSMGSIFMHTNGVNKCLMVSASSEPPGMASLCPLCSINGRLMNDIGLASSLDPAMFRHKINKISTILSI